MCVWTAGAVRGGKAAPRQVAIEVSRLRLPLLPRDPLPPELSWGGETRILTKLAFTFLGGSSPGLDLGDRSFFLFLFLERSALVIVANTCFSLRTTPPFPPATGRGASPPFLHLSFLPLSLLKVREWRRPISARLPFCEFNSEALGLREDAFAAPSASPVWRPRRGSRLAEASW